MARTPTMRTKRAAKAPAEAKCGPASTAATKWGEWENTEERADASARSKARAAAAAACAGDCSGDGTCKYKESGMELLDTEVFEPEDGGAVEYRTKARSSGSCTCD